MSVYSEKRVKKIERKHTNRCKKQTHRWRIVTNVHTLKLLQSERIPRDREKHEIGKVT